MKVHPLIAGAVISAMLGLQCWTLFTVNALSIKVAVVAQQVEDLSNQPKNALPHSAKINTPEKYE